MKHTSKRKRTRSDSASPMTKAPKFNNQLTTQKHHQKLRLHNNCGPTFSMVGWSNNSHPTGVVKPVYGYPTLPLTTTAV